MVKRTTRSGSRKAVPKQSSGGIKKAKRRRVIQHVEEEIVEEVVEEVAEEEDEPAAEEQEEHEEKEKERRPVMTVRTRRIATSVTRRRWSTLTSESRAQAIAILRDIERPVLMAIKNENRRTTAQTLIEHTINRIDSKLAKIPLPPGSKDRHFNYEKIVKENREMEASLVPDLELIGQLEKEIEREKMLLEQEEQQLENLTKNAAREESSRKGQMKKMHVLLRENVDSKNSLAKLNIVDKEDVLPYHVEGDEEIGTVMKQLGNHLTTLSTNLKDVKQVDVLMKRAEESLGEVLRRLEGFDGVDQILGAEVM